jgi:hypothetical protein
MYLYIAVGGQRQVVQLRYLHSAQTDYIESTPRLRYTQAVRHINKIKIVGLVSHSIQTSPHLTA